MQQTVPRAHLDVQHNASTHDSAYNITQIINLVTEINLNNRQDYPSFKLFKDWT